MRFTIRKIIRLTARLAVASAAILSPTAQAKHVGHKHQGAHAASAVPTNLGPGENGSKRAEIEHAGLLGAAKR